MMQPMPEASARTPLPGVIEHYLDRALPADGGVVRQVAITQTGEMFRNPAAKAMRFIAVERFGVTEVAFSWEARFSVAPVVSLKVTDGFSRGRGALRLRALGLPLQTQSGPDVDLGEAYRYLAELPWVPHAMAANRELEWGESDEKQVEVATAVGDRHATVRLEFNEAGDIARCTAEARPGTVNGRSVQAAWGGDLSDYDFLGGIWMPTRGEVYWDLPEGRFVYWRGEITSAQALSEAYPLPEEG